MKDPCSLEIEQAADYPDFYKTRAWGLVFTLGFMAGSSRCMRVMAD
jgi:hypothetical protein